MGCPGCCVGLLLLLLLLKSWHECIHYCNTTSGGVGEACCALLLLIAQVDENDHPAPSAPPSSSTSSWLNKCACQLVAKMNDTSTSTQLHGVPWLLTTCTLFCVCWRGTPQAGKEILQPQREGTAQHSTRAQHTRARCAAWTRRRRQTGLQMLQPSREHTRPQLLPTHIHTWLLPACLPAHITCNECTLQPCCQTRRPVRVRTCACVVVVPLEMLR